jgi:hypothetical protein
MHRRCNDGIVPDWSQNNAMNAWKSLCSAGVIYHPRKNNNNQHYIDRILEALSTEKRKGQWESKCWMLDLHCRASGFGCGYSGNFLMCSIQAHPLARLLVEWCLKWPRQEGGGGSAHGKRDAEFMEGERRKKRGQGTDPLIFRFLVWYKYITHKGT